MQDVFVNVNDSVSLDTILGVYGSTGGFSTGPHIHVELDTDVANWEYTPTLKGGTTCGLKKGIRGEGDTSVNPLNVFKRKISAPENQTCTVDNDGVWCANITIPGTFR